MGFGAETTLCTKASEGTNTGYCGAVFSGGTVFRGVAALVDDGLGTFAPPDAGLAKPAATLGLTAATLTTGRDPPPAAIPPGNPPPIRRPGPLATTGSSSFCFTR